MKTHAFPLLASLALVSSAVAGGVRSPADSAPAPDLWQWFAGASVGYITGMEEEHYALQVGAVRGPSSADVSHVLFLMVGFSSDDRDYAFIPGIPGGRSEFASLDSDFIPITLNYRFRKGFADRWFAEIGGGLGIAIVDTDVDWSWVQVTAPPGLSGSGSDSDSSVRFYGDLAAAIGCHITPSAEVFLAARYLMMDQERVSIPVTGVGGYEAGANGEFLAELGFRWKF